MRAFTIKAAKAHLNESQLELAIDLTDVQAARLWRQLASGQKSGGTAVFSSAAKAVQRLSKPGSARRQRQSRV
jgi:hypothetical protein